MVGFRLPLLIFGEYCCGGVWVHVLCKQIMQIQKSKSNLKVLTCGGFHKWGYPIAGWFIREHPSING